MARKPGDVLARITLRPQVPMGAFQALGYVCVLGASEALGALGIDFAQVGWPQNVVDGRTFCTLATLRMRAGYDKGMFATCEVVAGEQVTLLRALGDEELGAALEAGVAARVAAWEERVVAGAAAAGPLAPILSDYFDALALMGRDVEVVYPNGRVMARGELAGVDVWGRASVRTSDGHELDIAPEQASIRSAR